MPILSPSDYGFSWRLARLVRFLVLAVGVAGCQGVSDRETSDVAKSGESLADPSFMSQGAAASEHRASASEEHVKATRMPPSWNEALDRMTLDQREYLAGLNDRYMGVLRYQSVEEAEELARLGFPTPEEWLAARDLTDRQLQEMASERPGKASLFHANRTLEKFDRLDAAKSRGSIDKQLQDQLVISAADAHSSALVALRTTRSPLAAYIAGISDAKTAGSPEPIAAGIQLAGDLGDPRAQALLKGFNERHPEANVALIHQAYLTMRRIAGLN